MLENVNRWMREQYGSRRGFICVQWHRMLYYSGYYNKYRRIKWGHVDRLVFVCKGNICRSPFAELVARSEGMNSISCGINTVDGAPANEKAIEAATRKGEDLGGHVTRTIASVTMRKGDLFVVMEPWQGASLKSLYGNSIDCTLLGIWNFPVFPYIHDPYGSAPSYFDRCFEQVEKSVCGIKSEIQKATSN